MNKMNWVNGTTKLNKDTMDTFQNNISNGIDEAGVIVSTTEPTTDRRKVWLQKGTGIKDKVFVLNDSNVYEEFNSTNGILSGSNANGNYIKFPDGTLICTNKVTITPTDLKAWGVIYESTNNSLGNFAYSFSEIPVVTAICYSADYYIEGIRNVTTNSAGTINLAKPVSTKVVVTIMYTAIGRWK